MLTKMESRILYRFDNEQVMIEPWGLDALRVRATCAASFTDGEDHALLPAASVPVQISIDEKGASIINGHIRCDIDRFGVMTFLRDGKPILREYERNRYAPTDPCAPRWKSARACTRRTPARAAAASPCALRPTTAKSSTAWANISKSSSI